MMLYGDLTRGRDIGGFPTWELEERGSRKV